MANTDNPNGFKVWKSGAGSSPKIKWMPANASQTIEKGDAVILNTTGDLNIAVSDSGALYGVAAGDVTTTAADEQTKFPVYVFDGITEFIGQCSGTFAASLVGDFVDIEGATGVMEVNENAGTEKVLQIIGYHPSDEIGANTRAVFKCVLSQYQGTEVS
jgi:hypothetical protein